MKLLDEFSHTDFAKYAKNYNVNVNGSTRMVHRKDGCYYSKPSQFIPFDTPQEIEAFEKDHDIKFTYCQNPKCGFKN